MSNTLVKETGSPKGWAAIRPGTIAVVLIMGILVPLGGALGIFSIEIVNMLGRYLTFAIVALGLDLIWGYTGILSLAQSFFFSLGGYAMGMYLTFQGKMFNGIPESLYVVYPYAVGEAKGSEVLPWFWVPFEHFLLAILLGLLVPGVIAGIVGYLGFASKVKGVYFSILTQALTVAATMFFSKNEMFFAGTNGLTHFKTILGLPLTETSTKIVLYLATFFALLGAYLVARKITKTKFGRILLAIRDNEKALVFQGYKPHLFKTAIFAFAGVLAGLGGLLYTPQANIITPSFMEAKWSILMVVWVAVGGRGSLTGAIIGAVGVNLLYNALTSEWSLGPFTWSPEYWPIVLGLLFILVVLVFPQGLRSLYGTVKERLNPLFARRSA